MNIYTSLPVPAQERCIIALGCFDGVHLGHEAVIREALRASGERSLPLSVFSFQEPPKNLFATQKVPVLTPLDEKAARIEALGADTLFCVPFDRTIAEMSAEAFFALLCEDLGACHIVCGFNFTFGAHGRGDTALLQSLCEQKGIGLSVLPPAMQDGEPISSSRIRAYLLEGNTEKAASLLGRPYSLTAPVEQGQHLARSFGIPTANQCFPTGQAVPRYGVYAVSACVDGRAHRGVANVGMRPTVKGHLLCCETHLFDLSADLYGKELTVEFLHFLRPEQTFDSVDALFAQIRLDIERAKAYKKD